MVGRDWFCLGVFDKVDSWGRSLGPNWEKELVFLLFPGAVSAYQESSGGAVFRHKADQDIMGPHGGWMTNGRLLLG